MQLVSVNVMFNKIKESDQTFCIDNFGKTCVGSFSEKLICLQELLDIFFEDGQKT